MVYRAYDPFDLLTDCPAKIEAVESYASSILLGCSDGCLRVYGPPPSAWSPPPDSRSELQMQPYVLQRSVAGFVKRPFLSMEVLASRELLLTLSESVAFHRLPNLETVAVLPEARGANVCSWDEKRGFLCFARQNRVFIFRYDGGMGFVEVKEFGVPDTVKSLSWCGENICLGIRREYMIMNATNGALSEVFPCGRLAPPLVVPLPSGELILGKDNIGILVDQTGKPLPEGRICWSEAPQEVVIQKTYAIGLLPRYVEIRSLRVPYPLIQTVVLQNVCHLAQSSSAIVVAQDNSVYGFFPVPIGSQLVPLMASGNFEEALALCKMFEDSNLQSSKEKLIHIGYARHLFENGRYEEAMDHFLASEVDITRVLCRYPSIILPKTTWVPKREKLPPPHSQGLDEHSALVKLLQKKRCSIIEKVPTEGTEEMVLDAVGDSIPSYDINWFKRTNKRRAIISFSSVERDMATILDTALLQALLLTGRSSAAVELLKSLNYCDVKICEEILQESSHYTALLELYKSNSMHSEALKVLHHLEESKSSESKAGPAQKFKPEMIIEYLKPLFITDPIPANLVNPYLKQHAPNMQEKEKVQRQTPAGS